jgi:hypothetical protein
MRKDQDTVADKPSGQSSALGGYIDPVPLDRDRLKNKGISENRCALFARSQNIVPLNLVEFFQAEACYPIAFYKQGDHYMSCAVLGLFDKQNLFVDDNGCWPESVYVPAYIRRYPFITQSLDISAIHLDEHAIRKPVFVDAAALTDDAPPLFIANQAATAEWERYDRFIADFISAEKMSIRFATMLDQLKLLKPFDVNVHPKHGDKVQLKGLYRVDENLLNDLPASTVKSMMHKGELSRIYAHLISLEKFARLLDMSALQQKQPESD